MKKLIFTTFVMALLYQSIAQKLPVELRVQTGHYSQVLVTIPSPDGQFIASGGYDRTIIIWNASDGRELRRIELESYIKSLDFSPDGKLMLSVQEAGMAQVHDIKTGKLLYSVGTRDHYFRAAKFLPKGNQFIASGGTGTATIWSIKEDEPVGVFEGERAFCNDNCQRSIAISPDGKWLLTVDAKGQVIRWNTTSRKSVRVYKYYENKRLSYSGVTAITFTPDGQSFIIGSEEEGIIQWSLNDQKKPRILLPAQRITSGLSFKLNDLAVNFDGTRLAAIYLEGIQGSFNRERNIGFHLYDLISGNCIDSLDIGGIGNYNGLCYFPKSDELLIPHHAIPEKVNPKTWEISQQYKGYLTEYLADYWIMRATKKHLFIPPYTVLERSGNQILSWDFKTGKMIRKYQSHDDLVLAMAVTSDQKLLATGGADGNIWLSDYKTGDTLWSRNLSESVFSLCFSPDGSELVSAHMGGRIVRWNTLEGTYIDDLPNGARQWYQTPLNMVFTGTGLISWGDFLREYEKGTTLVDFDSHTDRVHDLIVSRDGKTLITAGWDGQIILRELYYGGKVITISQSEDFNSYCLSLNPEENVVYSGDSDNRIRCYDLDGNLLRTIEGHTAPVISITVTEDGKYLISGSQDGTVKVWKLDEFKEVYTHILIDEKRWTTQVPTGHFYSTQEGMESMFFVRGMESYNLDQFFEEFYQPKLTIDLLGSVIQQERNLYNEMETAPPPKVEIVYPSGGETIEKQIELIVKVDDNGGGISEVKVLHNGKRISSGNQTNTSKSGKSITQTYALELVPGANHIQASAFNQARIESVSSEIKLLTPANEPTSNCYLISIGINQYKNPRLNLNYAVG